MSVRMSELFQKLGFRSDLLGNCNHVPMSFAEQVAGGRVGRLLEHWRRQNQVRQN